MLEKIDSPDDLKRLTLSDLRRLAGEIRECLIRRVTENGGHLASNLGVVELTLALHYVFDSPRDAIVWDVGHQAYVHKLVTGRRDRFATIRQHGGLSGFCAREESPHDAFGAGHAATSVSAALGLAVARDLQGQPGHVIAVIGDGALTSGLAFEGLNNAGHVGRRLIVVINDNKMSIAPNVGAMARYLARLRTDRRYHLAKASVEWVLLHVPAGKNILRTLRRFRQAARALLMPTVIWEELGFTYVGPLDGHNLRQLIDVFQRVRDLQRPTVVHVATVKGRGYAPAEADAVALHGVPPSNGSQPADKAVPTYTKVFGETLVELAQSDRRIVAITAAMPDGTGLSSFARQFPDRFFDVGIAEAHAVTFAAGLAVAGLRPVAAIYSSFLQRAYDSVVHDVCIQKLPVVLVLDRAGLVGEDGRTHHGIFDLSYLRSLPNLVVMAPRDEGELRWMLRVALTQDGPVAIRYPRGCAVGVPLEQDKPAAEIGRAEVLLEGRDVAVVALGSMVHPALAAARQLRARGVDVAVVDARFAKPLDEATILEAARSTGRLVSVEENVLAGGFGSAIAELLADRGLGASTRLHRIGLPDAFVEHGPQALLRELHGLTAEGIVRAVEAAFPELTSPVLGGSRG